MNRPYRNLGAFYVDDTGVHRGSPPTEEDYRRISIHMAHRLLFGPYDAEITTEIPIAEAKRRYPEMFNKKEGGK